MRGKGKRLIGSGQRGKGVRMRQDKKESSQKDSFHRGVIHHNPTKIHGPGSFFMGENDISIT